MRTHYCHLSYIDAEEHFLSETLQRVLLLLLLLLSSVNHYLLIRSTYDNVLSSGIHRCESNFSCQKHYNAHACFCCFRCCCFCCCNLPYWFGGTLTSYLSPLTPAPTIYEYEVVNTADTTQMLSVTGAAGLRCGGTLTSYPCSC